MEVNSFPSSSSQTSKPDEYNEKKSKSDDEDRISGLPEPILHHILSFLETKQLVQVSILSKRWRYVWMSVPDLSFDHLTWKPNKNNERNQVTMGGRKKGSRRQNFKDFVDRVLLLRDNSNIHRFRLSCGDYCSSGKIETWVAAALRRHVHELNLEFSSCAGEPLIFRDSFFASTVRMFTMRAHRFSIDIRLPISLCSAAHLKSLHLVTVRLPKGDSNGELLLSCPILEKLIIENCPHDHLKVLNVSAFQLKSLALKSCCGGSYDCKFRICTPNLTSFQMEGSIYKDFYVENLSSLVSAHIEVNSRCLIKVLKGLYKAKTLTLSGFCFWTYKQSPGTLERLPEPFHNLKYLRLTHWIKSSHICALADLLQSFPYLETLILEILQTELYTSNNGEDCGAHSTFHCVFYHLKSVHIHNIKGHENELKLLEFLLENAVNLENITITTRKTLSSNCEKALEENALEEFSKKLQLLPRASSSATISFLNKNET